LFEKGDALPSLLFNFAIEYATRRVQVNNDGLKLNGEHQLLVHDDDDANCIGWKLKYYTEKRTSFSSH
jgi:hypothetical protein